MIPPDELHLCLGKVVLVKRFYGNTPTLLLTGKLVSIGYKGILVDPLNMLEEQFIEVDYATIEKVMLA
jgi:hypothetical protein